MNIKAKTYAQSLWGNMKTMSLPQVNEVLETMQFISDVYKNDKKIRDFLNHPKIARETKEKFMHLMVKTAHTQEVVGRFLVLLLQQKQLQLLPAVLHNMNMIRNEYFGVLQTKVISATALSEEQKKVLTETLQKSFQAREVLLEEALDTDLLGGLVVHVNDLVINNSLSFKLSKVKEQIRSA